MTEPRIEYLSDGTEVIVHGSMHDPFADGATPGPRFDPDPVLDPFAIAKHADHDQSNHGNWARGGRSVSQDVALRTEVEGGATNRGGSRVKSGKSLSIHPERSRSYPNGSKMNRAAVAAAVQRYRNDHADMLNNGYALGTWLDSETGILWLDVITVVRTAEEADSLARQHNQIAYYDIDQGKEVRTGGTGLTKRGLTGRLRGWLHAGGGSGAPEAHAGVPGRRAGRGDRGSDRGAFDPFGLAKHAGPGNHPGTGSPQSVHSTGGGGSGPGGASAVGAGGSSSPSIPPVPAPALSQALQSHPHAPAVQGLLRKIISVEPDVTEDLLSTAVENGGGMAGLEFRFKKADGLVSKIERKAKEKGISPEEALARIDDALRYTMTFPHTTYGPSVKEALADLEASGFTVGEVENNWSMGDAYNGINTVVERDGVRMELQFHTPESFERKMKNHADYEFLREGTGTDIERFEAFERMQEFSDQIPMPSAADLRGIGVDRHRPFEPLGKARERMRNFLHVDGTLVRFDAKRAMTQVLREGKWTDAAGYITALIDPTPGDRMSEIEPGTPVEKRLILASLVEKFNPSQPRYPKGHPLGGKWMDAGASSTVVSGDRIAPHYQQPYVTPSGRGGAPENFDATRMVSMSPTFRADIERRFAEVGIEPVPDVLVDNLDMLMERIKAEHPELVEIGKSWYADAQNRIVEHATRAGVDLKSAIGMTAAMSPNSEWGQNIALAGEMMRQLKEDAPVVPTEADMAWLAEKTTGKKGQNYATFYERLKSGETPRPSELSDIEAAISVQLIGRRRELVSENPTLKGTFGKVAFATGTRNMEKAVAMYRGADPDKVLGGHKVRSFYNNLSDPYDSRGSEDVTIDTHAASAAQLFRMPMTAKRADNTIWGGSSTEANQQGAYPVYADAFRQVARKHGMTTNQAQAVLWIGWQQVRHEYPGIVVSEDAKTLASGVRQQDVYGPARASTVGRYGIQAGETSSAAPPRYKSQVSAWKRYNDGKMSWADYQAYLERTPS